MTEQLESQLPVYSVCAPAIDTLGDLATDLTSAYRMVADPWQRYVLDNWLATSGGH